MTKLLFTILTTGLLSFSAPIVHAQMMGGFSNISTDVSDEVVEHTLREEEEGRALWEGMQAKEVVCGDLDDEAFAQLGEYFMGQMMGESHAAMNAMMIQVHGQDGEEEIHVVMGERLSGCDTSAVGSGISAGWMPMMGMMSTGWPNTGYGFGFFGWTFMVLWWTLAIVGIIALVKWIARK